MTLSVVILAKDAAGFVEELLRAGRTIGDELIIGVDSSSTDATLPICRKFADKLF